MGFLQTSKRMLVGDNGSCLLDDFKRRGTIIMIVLDGLENCEFPLLPVLRELRKHRDLRVEFWSSDLLERLEDLDILLAGARTRNQWRKLTSVTMVCRKRLPKNPYNRFLSNRVWEWLISFCVDRSQLTVAIMNPSAVAHANVHGFVSYSIIIHVRKDDEMERDLLKEFSPRHRRLYGYTVMNRLGLGPLLPMGSKRTLGLFFVLWPNDITPEGQMTQIDSVDVY